MATVRVLFVACDAGSIPRVPAQLESHSDRLSVRIATTARDALDQFESVDETSVDCVVTERLAAAGEPLGFIDWIRSTLPSVPIVLFPPDGDEDLASAAFERDVADYVPKRDDPDRFDRLASGVLAAVEASPDGPSKSATADEPIDSPSAGRFSAEPSEAGDATSIGQSVSPGRTPSPNQDDDRFATLFETLPAAAIHVEYRGDDPIVSAVNDAFVDTFGYDRAEIQGESLDEYVRPPGDRTEAVGFDGRAIDDGRVQTVVERATRDGDRYFLLQGTAQRIADRVEGIAIYTDVTEQLTRDRRLTALNRVLCQTLRDDMNAVIDHATSIDSDDETTARVDEIRETARDVARVGEHVRTLADVLETSRWAEADDIVSDAVELIELATAPYAVRDDVDVELELPNTAPVTADKHLVPALDIVLENAIDHADRTPVEIPISIELGLDGVTEIVIEDEGSGISSAECRAFDVDLDPDLDVDLDQLTRGGDLDLWMVDWIVTAFGGEVVVDDEGSAGTTVRLRLPSGCQPID